MKKKAKKKCLVMGCPNHRGEGRFVGDLCSPCHETLTTGAIHRANRTFIGDLKRIADHYRESVESVVQVLSLAGHRVPQRVGGDQ